jgi:hypothetical protein
LRQSAGFLQASIMSRGMRTVGINEAGCNVDSEKMSAAGCCYPFELRDQRLVPAITATIFR